MNEANMNRADVYVSKEGNFNQHNAISDGLITTTSIEQETKKRQSHIDPSDHLNDGNSSEGLITKKQRIGDSNHSSNINFESEENADEDNFVGNVSIQRNNGEIHSALSSACSSPVHEQFYESSAKDSECSISSSAASSLSSQQVPPAPPCTPVAPNRPPMEIFKRLSRFQDVATPKSDSSQSSSTLLSNANQPFESSKGEDKKYEGRRPPHNDISDTFDSWKVGSRYELIRILGRGSYGEVAQARDLESDNNYNQSDSPKYVAIKKIPMAFDQEVDALRFYREIHLLRLLKGHDCIIQLIDMIAPESEMIDDFHDIYLVFEYIDTDLYKLIMSPQYLTTAHIKTFMYQILKALKYMHSCSVIHRDLKPANILLNEDCSLKVCDFGLARIVDQGSMAKGNDDSSKSSSSSSSDISKNRPLEGLKRQLTKHVVTRWYRAPELILIQPYSSAVDIWSVGCIFAELLSMQEGSVPSYEDRVPLFPGGSCFPLSGDKGSPVKDNERLDQLSVIFGVIGTPSEDDVKSIGNASEYIKSLKWSPSKSLDSLYPAAEPAAIDLLKKMLQFNPLKRCTAEEALGHPFFTGLRKIESELTAPVPFTSPAFIDVNNVGIEEIKKEALKEILLFKSQS